MKRIVLPCCFLALMSACSNLFLNGGASVEESEKQMIVETTKSEANLYFVTEDDIRDYVRFKSLSEKRDVGVIDITPYESKTGEASLYIVNYVDGGWDLIAADKRYDPILAKSESGYLSENELIPPIKEWLDTYVEDLYQFKTYLDSNDYSGEKYDMAISNVDYWSMVTLKKPSVENNSIQTKSEFDPTGNWEIISITTDTLEYQVVNHLILTHWHQDAPYNSYCPSLYNSSSLRAPAGCVAIAGAQVAYFLHNKIGLPQTAPLTAFCDAQIPSNNGYYTASESDPHMNVGSFNSSAWSLMGSSDDYIAKLIAQVGIGVLMEYHNSYSLSTIAYLPNGYFIPNGISCSSYTPIDSNTCSSIYNNIISGYPVIARAMDSIGNGHAFIIDGYMHYVVRFTTTYAWVPLDPNNPNYYDNRVEIMDRACSFVTMNWGWGNTYPFDSGWYTVSANWQAGGDTFTSNKYMIYNFGIL